LQTFKVKMQQELNNNDSPLDAHLQAVLPGVHQRMELHRQELSCLRGDVGRLTTAVETNTQVMTDKVDDIIQMNEEKNAALGRMHIMVGSRLLGQQVLEKAACGGDECDEESNKSPSSSPPSSPRRPLPPPRPNGTEDEECPKYHLNPQPRSFYALYNEWYGGGPDFEDVPVPGGIAALEEKFKARWRRHFKSHEVKEFSRRRMCINAIEVYATREGVSQAKAIDKLNDIFEQEAKRKVPCMANLMQRMGLIEKKARRGKATNLEEATE
jgi:hypothetical protein